MKKRLIAFLAAVAMSAAAMAQGNFPTVYSSYFYDIAPFIIHHTWSGVVSGDAGQGLGLVAPGVKKIVSKIDNGNEYLKSEWTHELHPNGLTKSDDAQNGQHTYNYDSQWRIQSILDKDGKVVHRYFYDDQKRLQKYTYSGGINDEYTYQYDAAGNLSAIKKVPNGTYTIKDSCLTEVMFKEQYLNTWPAKFTYDKQKRVKSFYSIVEDGMDEVEIIKTEYTFNYGNGPLPTSITRRSGVFNPKKNIYVGKPEVTNVSSTFTLDSHGNWTSWKLKGSWTQITINRTITYYTDDEVKAALAEMKAARQGKKEKKEEKKEEMWEF